MSRTRYGGKGGLRIAPKKTRSNVSRKTAELAAVKVAVHSDYTIGGEGFIVVGYHSFDVTLTIPDSETREGRRIHLVNNSKSAVEFKTESGNLISTIEPGFLEIWAWKYNSPHLILGTDERPDPEDPFAKAWDASWCPCGEEGGGVGTGRTQLEEKITALNVNLGDIKTGDEFDEGTFTEDIWRRLLINGKGAKLSLRSSGSNLYEIGEFVDFDLNSKFVQNQAGDVIQHMIDGDTFGPVKRASRTISGLRILDPNDLYNFSKTYESQVSYDTSNDPETEFDVGVVVASEKIRGARPVFYGFDMTTPITSDKIRNLDEKLLGVAKGDSFSIDVPKGANTISIAYPANYGDVEQIAILGVTKVEQKNDWTKIETMVNAANDSNGDYSIPYFVYTQGEEFNVPYDDIQYDIII